MTHCGEDGGRAGRCLPTLEGVSKQKGQAEQNRTTRWVEARETHVGSIYRRVCKHECSPKMRMSEFSSTGDIQVWTQGEQGKKAAKEDEPLG